jgi:hypothetical protein
MLDEALNWAETGFRATIVRFQQPARGVCMSLVIRWVKYRILSKDFWAEQKKGNKFIQTPHIRSISAYDLSDYRGDALGRTTEEVVSVKRILNEKFGQKHLQRQISLEAGGAQKRAAHEKGAAVKYSPETTMLREVEKSKKIAGTWNVTSVQTYKPQPVEDIQNVFAPLQEAQGVIIKLIAKGPQNSGNHYVAAHVAGSDKWYFFDPNMGEAVFQGRQHFLDWFENYKSSWRKFDFYKDIKSFAAKQYKGALHEGVDPFAGFVY